MNEVFPNTDGMNEDAIREKWPQFIRCYDIGTDMMRFATQEDFDIRHRAAMVLGKISVIVRDHRKAIGAPDDFPPVSNDDRELVASLGLAELVGD